MAHAEANFNQFNVCLLRNQKKGKLNRDEHF